jgi:hypothetical protein
MSSSVSVLRPVDPTSIQNDEKEKSAPWIVSKLVEVFLSISWFQQAVPSMFFCLSRCQEGLSCLPMKV